MASVYEYAPVETTAVACASRVRAEGRTWYSCLAASSRMRRISSVSVVASLGIISRSPTPLARALSWMRKMGASASNAGLCARPNVFNLMGMRPHLQFPQTSDSRFSVTGAPHASREKNHVRCNHQTTKFGKRHANRTRRQNVGRFGARDTGSVSGEAPIRAFVCGDDSVTARLRGGMGVRFRADVRAASGCVEPEPEQITALRALHR